MRIFDIIRPAAAGAALCLALAAAPPTMAQVPPANPPAWKEGRHAPGSALDPEARAVWLAECRRRMTRRDNGWGGAALGGVIGGFAGNRIAGHGHRTVGTIAGAAVGAVAGAAIDKAEDAGRARDECETYLDDYLARVSQPRVQPGYIYVQPAYAPGQGCCTAQPAMVPAARPAERECTETVEYIYETVPVRPRARRVPDKRIRIVPDKRVRN